MIEVIRDNGLLKTLYWFGDTLEELKRLPYEARVYAATQLRRMQIGMRPDRFHIFDASQLVRTMGMNVCKLRIHSTPSEEGVSVYSYLFLHVVTGSVYVLHVHTKKFNPNRCILKRDEEIIEARCKSINDDVKQFDKRFGNMLLKDPEYEKSSFVDVSVNHSITPDDNVFSYLNLGEGYARKARFLVDQSFHQIKSIKHDLMSSIQIWLKEEQINWNESLNLLGVDAQQMKEISLFRTENFNVDDLLRLNAKLGIKLKIIKTSNVTDYQDEMSPMEGQGFSDDGELLGF